MPTKPLKACGKPFCPNRAAAGKQFCPEHEKVDIQNYNASYDASLKAFYSSKAWRSLRALKLERDPLCQRCLRRGIVEEAQMVHHLVPIAVPESAGGPWLPSLDGLESLSNACHNSETKRGIVLENSK